MRLRKNPSQSGKVRGRLRPRGWKIVGVTVLAVLLVVVGAGIAMALIPQGNTVNACRDLGSGTIRVIDPASQSCSGSEAALSWTTWKWRGNYSGKPTYNAGDVVQYNGTSYVARVNVPTGIAPNRPNGSANVSYWGRLGPEGTHAYTRICGLPCTHDYPRNTERLILLQLSTAPPGDYLVTAKVQPGSNNVGGGKEVVACGIIDHLNVTRDVAWATFTGQAVQTISLQATGHFNGIITLSCRGSGHERWFTTPPGVNEDITVKMTAISLDTLDIQPLS